MEGGGAVTSPTPADHHQYVRTRSPLCNNHNPQGSLITNNSSSALLLISKKHGRFTDYLDELSENRTVEYIRRHIHILGLDRVLDRDKSKRQRLIWIVILIASFSFLFYHLYDRISFYSHGPFLVDLHSERPIEMTFPAVTICQLVDNSKPCPWRGLSQYSKMRDAVIKKVIKRDKNPVYLTDPGIDWPVFLEHLWPPLNFTKCEWTYNPRAEKKTVCSKKMRNTYAVVKDLYLRSFFMHCYTLYSKDWIGQIDSYIYLGLSKYTHGCSIQNLYLSVHHPDEPPRFRESFVKIELLEKQKFYVTMKRTDFKSQRPRCDVRKLRYLKRPYTQMACQTECFVNFTMAQYNCFIPIEVPMINSLESCPLNLWLWNKTIFNELYDKFRKIWGTYCDCPDACFQQEYEVQSVKSTVSEKEKMAGDVRLFIKYRSNRVTVIFQHPALSFLRLLSELGGVLGLVLGIRILTIVEFIDVGIMLVFCRKRAFKTRHGGRKSEMNHGLL